MTEMPPELKMSLFRSILMITICFQLPIPAKETLKGDGEPYLSNCFTSYTEAEKIYFTRKRGFALHLLWSNPNSTISDPLQHYTFQFTAVKWGGDPEEEPAENFDLSPFIINYIRAIRFRGYILKPGTYKVTMIAKPNEDVEADMVEKECYFKVKPLNPIIVFNGGLYRKVPENKEIVLSAKHSLDPNNFLGSQLKTLNFTWTCEQKIGEHCLNMTVYSSKTFTVFQNMTVPGEVIDIFLNVTSTFGSFTFGSHKMVIASNAAILQIKCIENCVPVTTLPNAEKPTIFHAYCISNCNNIKDEDFEWKIVPKKEISGFTFNSTLSGKVLIIPENSLKDDNEYTITLKLKEELKQEGEIQININYMWIPTTENCSVTPEEGIKLKTWFLLKCDVDSINSDNHFAVIVYSKQNSLGEVLVNGYMPYVFYTKFFMPSSRGHYFIIAITKDHSPPKELDLHVTVTSKEQCDPRFDEISQKYSPNEISTMLQSNHSGTIDEGLEILTILINEIVCDASLSEEHDLATKIVDSVIKELSQSSAKVILKLGKIFKVISDLIDYHLLVNDTVTSEIVSSLCQMMILGHGDQLKTGNAYMNKLQFTRTGILLERCVQMDLNWLDLLRKTSNSIQLSSISEVPLETGYNEDTDYSSNLDELNDKAMELQNAMMHYAQELADDLELGKHIDNVTNEKMITFAAKNTGPFLSDTKFLMPKGVLVPSLDLSNSDENFNALISVTNKDRMWWNKAQTQLATYMYNIRFLYDSSKRKIRYFKDRAHLLLNVVYQDHIEEILINGNISVPDNYESLNRSQLDSHMNVYRLDVPPLSTILVAFENISVWETFDISRSIFEYPTSKLFEINHTITSTQSNYFSFFNDKHHGVWGYVAVLPSKNGNYHHISPVMFYKIRLLILCCVRWQNIQQKWKQSCKPGIFSNHRLIHCRCRRFSIYGGYQQNTVSHQQSIFVEEVTMELQVCLIIFITVAVVIFLYSVLLCRIHFKQKSKFMFLSDNIKSHPYSYLLFVRTNNSISAGTTSKVMINITGTKDITGVHVLNYPDPKMYLLQGGTDDRYIIMTRGDLGRIKEIEIWLDFTGPSSSWYCRSIVVYDIQKDQQWYFRIRTLFSLTKGVTFLRALPNDPEAQGGKVMKCYCCTSYHSWILTAADKHFSFLSRLTVLLSHILTVGSFLVIFNGVPSLQLMDCFDRIDTFRLTFADLKWSMISGVISFTIHLQLAWLFRLNNLELFIFQRPVRRAYKLMFYCWLILIVMILFWASFLIIVGFFVPFQSSLLWLLCLVITVLFVALVLENVYIFFQGFYCRLKATLVSKKDILLSTKIIEGQKQFLFEKFGPELLRPYLSHLYKPLKRIDLARKKIIQALRERIYNDLEDLILYGIYNVLLYLLILSQGGHSLLWFQNNLSAVFEGNHTRTFRFSMIDSIPETNRYLAETFLDVIHPSHWYENYKATEMGLILDNVNKYIGVARIRQKRIRKQQCSTPKFLKFLLIKDCFPEYSFYYGENKDYGAKWQEYDTSDEVDDSDIKTMWQFQTSKETGTRNIWGEIALYSGSGYVTYLSRTFTQSQNQIKKLLRDRWIDDKTRAVMIEFLVYNGNTNLFVSVTLMVEESSTGYIENTMRINVGKLLLQWEGQERVSFILHIIYLIWTIVLFIKLIADIIRHATTFYKNIVILIDITIFSLALSLVVIFYNREEMIKSYLLETEKVEQARFINYSYMFYLEEAIVYISGVLVIIATLRLWKFLRFGTFFRVLEKTLKLAAYPLLAVTFSFAVVLTAFGLSGLLIYGNDYWELSGFVKIVATLIQLSLKPDQFDLKVYLNLNMSYAYFALYLIMMQIILLIYVTVIIMAYVKAQLELSVEPESFTVFDYVRERIDFVPRVIKAKFHRFKGGEDIRGPVTPKADEFRYANCVTVQKNRMKAMKFVFVCFARNLKQTLWQRAVLTHQEVNMMLKVCNNFVLHWGEEEDELELFFKGHFEGKKIQVVDEMRIDMIATVVRTMFEASGKDDDGPMRPQVARIRGMVKRKNAKMRRCVMKLKLLVAKFEEVEAWDYSKL